MRCEMKKLLSILALVLASDAAYAGTCTTVSRSNVSANSVLTSTEYNNSLNTLYTNANAYDGGCITSGTLETDALNTTQFSPVLNGIREGCKVTTTDSNTISVDRCIITVNGNFLKTTSATTATWACTGCSAEVASTAYYVYVNNSSTFGIKFTTTAPNGDGYNASSERAIARFYNDSSSNITSVEQWTDGAYHSPRCMVTVYGGNGHGSTNTKIRRFASIDHNIGGCVTYADSAAAGGTFTINQAGTYHVSYYDTRSGAAFSIGITRNSNELTTSIPSVTDDNDVLSIVTQAATLISPAVTTYMFAASDVIRGHTDGAVDGGSNAKAVRFTITKVGD